MKNTLLYSHLKLHLVVLVYGFTAILGKLITMPAHQLVWYRMFIALISFILYFSVKRTNFLLPVKEIFKILSVGLIVGAHWIAFFGAIKLSNVSVALGCISSATLFTSLIEPLFFRKKLSIIEVVIGVFIVVGLYLIFQFETKYWKGITAAVTCAFLAGLFSVLNRKLVARHKARVISFWEMLGGLLGITIFLLCSGNLTIEMAHPSPSDLLYSILLGTICTAFAFVVQVDVMKELTAYVVSLAINLEPVYGILLALAIFGESEMMSTGFYFGTIIILLSVFGYPILQRLKNRSPKNK